MSTAKYPSALGMDNPTYQGTKTEDVQVEITDKGEEVYWGRSWWCKAIAAGIIVVLVAGLIAVIVCLTAGCGGSEDPPIDPPIDPNGKLVSS